MKELDNQFNLLVKKTKSSVLSAISKNLKPDYAHMIDDVVQETYIRAYNSLKKNQFRYEASLNTWLYTIARNESRRLNIKINKLRSIEKKLDDSLLNERQLIDTTRELNSENKNQIQGKLEIINIIIGKLPQKYKSVLELDILGFKDWQIAEKLKINLGTVKSRNSRAREKIRQWAHQMKLST
ncbi:MAG: RNA polymerase sigma factor [Spirochaetia bacterium]|nr:RNA polymerase sigma factor [Spirochaetia bacterium]